MKKVLVLAAAIALFATPALAAIGGTKHDLSAAATNLQGQSCVFCHTPHGGALNTAPLWNRTNTVTYGGPTYYTSTTINANTNADLGDKLLCLSCHDGAMAENLRNVLGAATPPIWAGAGPYPAGTFAGVNNIAGDASGLSNDHPAGFRYDGAPDIELKNSTSDAGVRGLLFKTDVAGGEMWCSSCHDVHNQGSAAASTSPFLRASNANSALCTTCHIK